MKISISPLACLKISDPIKAVRVMNEAGFSNMELVIEQPHFSMGRVMEPVDELLRIKDELNLDYTVHAPFSFEYFTHVDSKFRKILFNHVKDSIKLANSLKAPYLVTHVGRAACMNNHILGENTKRECLKIFAHEIKPLTKDFEGMICVENQAHAILENPEDVSFLQEIVPELGFCWDAAHSHVQGNDEDFMNSELTINYFHLTDNDGKEDRHWPLGKGNMGLAGIKNFLKNIDYDGFVVLENTSIQEAVKSRKYWEDL